MLQNLNIMSYNITPVALQNMHLDARAHYSMNNIVWCWTNLKDGAISQKKQLSFNGVDH